MTYSIILNDVANTEIEVAPSQFDIDNYGLVQAIIEAGQANSVYKSLRSEQDASIHTVVIDGEEITQF